MKLEKSNNRDKKIYRKKNGMRINNRSIFVIMEILVKKAKKKGK